MNMNLLNYTYKIIIKIKFEISSIIDTFIATIKLKCNYVEYKNFRTGGVPHVMVARGAKGMTIGKNFAMNNGIYHNPIGMPQPCTFFVDRGCSITIGDNVGISQTALIAHDTITIGDNVKIGGGTCVYTSDFHSLDAEIRRTKEDKKYRKTAPVTIGNDVFIGARCIILKGVTVGDKSIVGAGSVVTKSIPSGEIWAGNPAKFIRKV